MYRQYEDPRKLQDQLDELLDRKDELISEGRFDDDAIEFYAQEEAELRERINFAWQDEEYDMANCSGEFEW